MSAREWIFVAIAVLAVYLVFQLIRALQVKDAGSDAQGDADTLDADADADGAEAPAADASGTPAPATVGGGDDSFGLALEIRQLRRDVAQLREELDAQRAEIATLRDTTSAQASALEAARAAQRVSPIYGEALALAQRGMAAEVIAERCSISVAEAELVQSLATEADDSGATK